MAAADDFFGINILQFLADANALAPQSTYMTEPAKSSSPTPTGGTSPVNDVTRQTMTNGGSTSPIPAPPTLAPTGRTYDPYYGLGAPNTGQYSPFQGAPAVIPGMQYA